MKTLTVSNLCSGSRRSTRSTTRIILRNYTFRTGILEERRNDTGQIQIDSSQLPCGVAAREPCELVPTFILKNCVANIIRLFLEVNKLGFRYPNIVNYRVFDQKPGKQAGNEPREST